MLIDRTETRSNVDILAAHTIEFRDFRTINIFTNGKPMNSLIINLFWLDANNPEWLFKILNGNSFVILLNELSTKNWSSRAV